VSGDLVLSRSRLKCGLLACLMILAATVVLQESALALWVNDAAYFVKTGSAASAIAICLALIATV
jgi:hypothetical protein